MVTGIKGNATQSNKFPALAKREEIIIVASSSSSRLLLREKSVLSAIETVGCRPPAPHPRPSSSFGTTIIMSSGWLCANEKKSLLCDDSVTEL
jgi:hypothetical protein